MCPCVCPMGHSVSFSCTHCGAVWMKAEKDDYTVTAKEEMKGTIQCAAVMSSRSILNLPVVSP